MIRDYVAQLGQTVYDFLLPVNVSSLWEQRNKKVNANYFDVKTSDYLSEEGIDWFASRGVPLRKVSWILCSIPNNSMIIHTDYSPCCFIFNLSGDYDLYYLRDEGVIDRGRFECMNYIMPDGDHIYCSKHLDMKYADPNNLPVIDHYYSKPLEATLIETKTIHYGVSGGAAPFIFWTPRPVDITLDYATVRDRLGL